MHEISDDLAKSLHDTLVANAHFEVLDDDLIPIKSKAIDLIKKKHVPTSLLWSSATVEDYNRELNKWYGKYYGKAEELTEDEFKLLKRLL